ncbi:L-type lectin-domain containing receptor kinase S.4-like [Tasmannia lanceolata]|uniref:L-type lectin-domain containing receptor kinase S.4-like n=1 Tax=Tasmannia lanceolata TaxID=3420 RepID=UPI004063B037
MARTLGLLWVFVIVSTPAFSQLNEFFYSGFSDVGTNISLNGFAEILKNGILQLTNHTSRLIGHAFYPSPLQFKNMSDGNAFSFSTAFAFAIVSEDLNIGGHGLVFTISPTKELKGALPSRYLGLLNCTNNGNLSNHIFAVEFDTVQDKEFDDIDDNHVGIDINSLQSNKSVSSFYFVGSSKNDLNLKSGKTIQAWIDYDGARKHLSVMISPFSLKPEPPIISVDLDLSPIIHDSMYVGFSASTGRVSTSSHYLLGWSFKMNGVAPSLKLFSLPSLPKPRKKNKTAIIIGIPFSAAFIMATAIYMFKKIQNSEAIEPWELEYGPHRFSNRELRQATKDFRDKELLGFGGFGRVYKGTLPNSKTLVAVKRVSHESKQGLREFVAEIASIGLLRHRNLVQLQGWCRRGGNLLLVYDFMYNGSLDKFLFDKPKSILNWEQRFNIIKGVASGLLYLHEGWEQIVIHRDIKAGNVLLDEDLNGRLGDFGMARLYEHGANPNTTQMVGTLGYMAPELTRTGQATTSSDVFAFGALLLEVTCGRRPIDQKAMPEEMVLVE